MKLFFKFAFLIVCICFVATTSFSEEKKENLLEKWMVEEVEKELERKLKEADEVRKFIGSWNGEMTITEPGEKPQKINATFQGKELSSNTVGVYVQIQEVGVYVQLRAGGFQEYNLWGYDIDQHKLHMYSVAGGMAVLREPRDYSGWWKNEKTLEVEWKGVEADGQPMYSRITFTWKSDKELSVTSVETLGGKPRYSIEGVFKKK